MTEYFKGFYNISLQEDYKQAHKKRTTAGIIPNNQMQIS